MFSGSLCAPQAHASQSYHFHSPKGAGGTVVFAETTAKKPAVTYKRNVDSHGVILKGYDPVAYIKQGKAVKGKPSLSSTYHGATYLFASKADKADFDASPAKFEPQYGAFCAGSLLNKQLKDIDPNVFYVYKGKLYLCSSPEAEKRFMAHPEESIRKADKNWDFYQPPRSPGFNEDLG